MSTAITHERITVDGVDLPLVVARGDGSGASVVILPSAFGVAADLEAQMVELAESAGVVVTFDPFFREDPGPVAYDDMARVMTRLHGLDRPRLARDFAAAIAWARGRVPGTPVVALGICFGGPFAFQAAAEGLVDGVVVWHGTRVEDHLSRAAEMRCPMRLHFGSVDPFVPPPAVDAVRVAFEGRAEVHIVVHDGATHGFSHRAAPQAYDPAAERAGMDSVREIVRALGAMHAAT